MKNARQLLQEFIATSFRDPKQAASMFTADGTFEIPYLEDLGFQPIYRGQDEISGAFQFVRDLYPGLEFRWWIRRPVLLEAAVNSYSAIFFGRLVSESGKIKCLREALNTAAAVRAVFPDDLSGIPAGAPLSDSP